VRLYRSCGQEGFEVEVRLLWKEGPLESVTGIAPSKLLSRDRSIGSIVFQLSTVCYSTARGLMFGFLGYACYHSL
jgi:hypothetical protein